MGSFKTIILYPSPPYTDLIDAGCHVGIRILRGSLGDAKAQQNLGISSLDKYSYSLHIFSDPDFFNLQNRVIISILKSFVEGDRM